VRPCSATSADNPGAAKAAAFAHSDSGQPFNLNYATHDGMFRNSAGDNFVDQIKFAYDQGFRSIEDNGMAKRPVEQQQQIGMPWLS
jgi:hydroxypyruvate isomerase